MGKGADDTTSTQKTEPWSGQQPYLNFGFQQAQNLYNTGGPQYYPNRTYVPFSSQTEQGLNMMQNRALQGSPVEQGMQQYVQNAMGGWGPTGEFLRGRFLEQGNPYFTGNQPATGAPITGLNVGRGFTDPQLGDPNNAAPLGGFNPSTGMNYTPSIGQSQQALGVGSNPYQYAGQTNPYLDQMFDAAASRVTETFNDQVLPGLRSSFAGAGGRGSGIQDEIAVDAAGKLADSLGQLSANLYGGAYDADMSRALQASQQDIARRQGAGNLFLGGGNLGLGAANSLSGIQRGAAALAPIASGLDYQNIDRLLGVGGAVEGKAGEVLQDSMNRFNYGQNQPYANLDRYMNTVGGPGYGSNITATDQAQAGSPLTGALGGALAGSSLAGALPWLSTPWGAGLGALVGLAGLL